MAFWKAAMRGAFAVSVVSLACFLGACVPGVGWLPDSSGFVYTTAKGQLIAYDLATKTPRVIMDDPAAATTCWPAMGIRGKKIALAHLETSNDKTEAAIEIVVCDQQGKIEVRTEKLKVATFTGKDLEYTTQVVWSPDETKLLVHCQGMANQGSGFDTSVLIDVATRKMQTWENHVPAYIGGSPIRPEGSGFLLAGPASSDHVGEYAWVDWTGKKEAIRAPEGIQLKELRIPLWMALFDSHWDGAKAVIPARGFIIDTDTLEAVQDMRKADPILGTEEILMRAQLASGVELFVLSRGRPNAVRVVARKKDDPTLTQIIAPVSDRFVLLSLSPDRKHAIVRVTAGYRGQKEDTIYVLNQAGEVDDTMRVRARLNE